MKKIILSLLLSMLSLCLFSQSGTLTLKSSNNKPFWVFIDDILQNQYATTSIQIVGMQPQAYKVRVEFDNAKFTTFGELLNISIRPIDNSYLVEDRYFTASRTISQTQAVISLIVPNHSYYQSYQEYLFPGFGNPNNYWGKSATTYPGYEKFRKGNSRGTNLGGGQSRGNPGHSGGSNHGSGQTNCMPEKDFNAAVTLIKKENFDSSKLNIAKHVTSKNRLCVNQIVEIANTFSSESNKLEYAKYAYSYCVDQQNYHLVNGVFSFTSSKNELNKFLETRR
ncbi:MAG: DUF4476 domain-containing protein [Bacteroidales bacterium]|nr:DUF4476 domain-containing protein [Bacteroidales bacterium]